jgi:hypothetical protein
LQNIYLGGGIVGPAQQLLKNPEKVAAISRAGNGILK